MKKGKFWGILLGVVVVVVVLSALGFGIFAHRMWGGRMSSMHRSMPFTGRWAPGAYQDEMPCEDDGAIDDAHCDEMA